MASMSEMLRGLFSSRVRPATTRREDIHAIVDRFWASSEGQSDLAIIVSAAVGANSVLDLTVVRVMLLQL